MTAKGNFTHALQFRQREGHVLVTHGIYRRASPPHARIQALTLLQALFFHGSLLMHGSFPLQRYLRHPGYAGWLLWVIGTQALLANPLCLVAFPIMVRPGGFQAAAYFA